MSSKEEQIFKSTINVAKENHFPCICAIANLQDNICMSGGNLQSYEDTILLLSHLILILSKKHEINTSNFLNEIKKTISKIK